MHMTKRTTENYLPPECEYEVTSPVDFICTSPETGGLEEVEYEDWVTQG